jgi:hypothetical protein
MKEYRTSVGGIILEEVLEGILLKELLWMRKKEK